IVHRDLKPANIKITTDDVVKVLDFGLAKALAEEVSESSLSHSPTLAWGGTRAGVILGTAAYMSPEQARGRAVDKRADVWAFGCVLYEMLTGRRAFEGEDVTETIAAVVRGEPDWSALPSDTPEQIRLLLRRCLEKDRRARVSDIGVARFLMSETIAPSPPVAARPTWRRVAAATTIGLLTGIVLAAVAAWAAIRFGTQPAVMPVRFA